MLRLKALSTCGHHTVNEYLMVGRYVANKVIFFDSLLVLEAA